MVTASVLRELPGPGNAGEASMYRLLLACNQATHEGEMQLAWAPMSTRGSLTAAVDGVTSVAYKVEGGEHMGNGTQATTGPAAIDLAGIPLPARALNIANLFPNESVEFSFGDVPQGARQSLAACFKKSNPSQ